MALISILALCAIVFGVAIRFYWAKTRGATHDTWYHLHLIESIRRERRLPDRVEQFLIPGPYDYPPVLHILLAVVPASLVSRYKWVFAPVVETIHLSLLMSVTYWLTQDISTVLIAGSIYATYTTQIVQFTALTPRVLGALLVSVLVLSVFYGLQTNTILPLAVAVFVGVVLLHTHKMSSQTVFFMFIVFSIIWLQPVYLVLVALIVLLAVIVSGGHYLTILKGHFSIINFWRHQYNAGRAPGEFMRQYGKQRSEQEEPDSIIIKTLAWVKRNEWTTFITDNIWTFLVVPIIIWGMYVIPEQYPDFGPFVDMLAAWAVFILVFAILTQYVPYFKLVGDGYKYFMWGAYPTAIVLAVTVPWETSVLFTIGYATVLVGSALYGFVRMHLRVNGLNPSSRNITTDGRAVVDFLEQSAGDNVFVLPFGMCYHLLYETDLNILFHANPKLEAQHVFPAPIEPLVDIVTEYDIDFVVIDTTKVDMNKLDTDPFNEVFEDAEYLVLAPNSTAE